MEGKVDNNADFTLKQGGNSAGTIKSQVENLEIIKPEAAKANPAGGMGPFSNPLFVVVVFMCADVGKALFDPFVRGTLVNSGIQGVCVCLLNLLSALAITFAAVLAVAGIRMVI